LDDQNRCDKDNRAELCVPAVCAPQGLALGREVFRVKIQCPSAGEASRWVTEISPQSKVEGEVTQCEGRDEKKLDSSFAQGFLQIWMEAA
jgi:hypothetical protein